jgi:hypothetical protein
MQKKLLKAKLNQAAPQNLRYSHFLDERFNLLNPENYLTIYGGDHRG